MIEGITKTSIDVNLIVSQLVGRASQPLERLKARRDVFQEQLSALQLIQSKLSNLRNIVYSLRKTGSSSIFGRKEAISSNESVLTANVSGIALKGVYDISVNSLATQHKVASGQFISTDLDIVNNEGTGTKTFKITINGVDTEISVDINAGDENATILNNIADAINYSGVEAKAIVVNETSNTSRLVITSTNKGSTNQMSFSDTGGTLLKTIGVIDIGNNIQYELVPAQDSNFTIDTLNFVRQDNVISDAIQGVTLNLLSIGNSTLTVDEDTNGVISALEDFVNTYNELISEIKTQTAYDVETKEASPLNTNTLIKSIPYELRSLATGLVSGQPEEINSLFRIGIEVDKEGVMSIVDRERLEAVLESDPGSVATLFNNPSFGIAWRIYNYLDNILGYSGKVTNSINNVNNRIEEINEDIEEFEAYLDRLEAKLLVQWSKVESLISNNDSLSLFMAQKLLPSYYNSRSY
ncbi:MAG: flagellar filament capping protein FliD [Candidatus Omnitrophica bacterium]|nr:flagellar filament capping protein FliD [Candidatus Omnitrophota bacterium]